MNYYVFILFAVFLVILFTIFEDERIVKVGLFLTLVTTLIMVPMSSLNENILIILILLPNIFLSFRVRNRYLAKRNKKVLTYFTLLFGTILALTTKTVLDRGNLGDYFKPQDIFDEKEKAYYFIILLLILGSVILEKKGRIK